MPKPKNSRENSPQKTNIKYSIKPSKSLLNNWKLWMAAEVVQQFISGETVHLKLKTIIESIVVDQQNIFIVQLNKLKDKIFILSVETPLQKLENIKYDLEEYFTQTIVREMQQISQDLIVKSTKKLSQLFHRDIKQASPKNLMQLLKDLLKTLWLRKSHFEKNAIDYKNQENSAEKAFLKLTDSFNSQAEYDSNKESIWNALSICFTSKLRAEESAIFGQATLSLIQLCQSYYESARLSLLLLERIHASLSQKCALDLISLPVFTQLKRINIAQQRELIEIYTGHHINHWGNAPVSWKQIETKLLENLESTAFELCKDFQRCYMECVFIK